MDVAVITVAFWWLAGTSVTREITVVDSHIKLCEVQNGHICSVDLILEGTKNRDTHLPSSSCSMLSDRNHISIDCKFSLTYSPTFPDSQSYSRKLSKVYFSILFLTLNARERPLLI